MVYGKPEDLARRRRGVPFGFDGAAEEQLKARASRAEFGRGREREIDLKTAGEQKDPVQRRAVSEIEQVNCLEFADDGSTPVPEHLGGRAAVRDPERQIEIRPAVARAAHCPADGGRGDNARVGIGQLEQALADAISLLNGEQRAILPKPASSAIDADVPECQQIERRRVPLSWGCRCGSARSRLPAEISDGWQRSIDNSAGRRRRRARPSTLCSSARTGSCLECSQKRS